VSVRPTPYLPPGRLLRSRLPDPTTVFAGPAWLANVRDQNEREALAVRCHTRSGLPPLRTIRRGAMVSGSAPRKSSIEIPLPEIGRKDVVHIHVCAAQEGTGTLGAVNHSLIKHRPGLALATGPCTRLPNPPVPCTG
jgi:hypothetical protein